MKPELYLPSWVNRHNGLQDWLKERVTDLVGNSLSVQGNAERRARYNRRLNDAREETKKLLKTIHSIINEGAVFNFFTCESPESKKRIEGLGEMNEDQAAMFYGGFDFHLMQYALIGLHEHVMQIQDFAPAIENRPSIGFAAWTYDLIDTRLKDEFNEPKHARDAVLSEVFRVAGVDMPSKRTVDRHKDRWKPKLSKRTKAK